MLKQVLLLVFLTISLAACSGQPAAPTAAPASANTAAEDTAAQATTPTWLNIELVNAQTGAPFRLADFAGKTVYVEPMATWCTNCRRQLKNVTEAVGLLEGNEDIVFIGISVETEITAATLKDYVEKQGYPFTFAVATPEMMQSLIDQFGQTVSNPPSTPHFVIRPDGTVSELKTGFEDAVAVVEFVRGN